MLIQLIYSSIRPENNSKDIENILEACKRNNPSLDITGVLLFSETKFIQLVEGPYKEIMALYDKIKTDPRHERCIMLALQPIKERAFPNWSMGFKKLYSNNSEYQFLTDLSENENDIFNELLNNFESKDGHQIAKVLQKFFNNTVSNNSLA